MTRRANQPHRKAIRKAAADARQAVHAKQGCNETCKKNRRAKKS
jgi:hypothetical protein